MDNNKQMQGNSSLCSLHRELLEAFESTLLKQRFWLIKKNNVVTGVFDAQSFHDFPPPSQLENILAANPFVWVCAAPNGVALMKLELAIKSASIVLSSIIGEASDLTFETMFLLESKSMLLWCNHLPGEHTCEEAEKLLYDEHWGSLGGWSLPYKERLVGFAKQQSNPYRIGENFRLKGPLGSETWKWLTRGGSIDVDENCIYDPPNKEKYGFVFACHHLWSAATPLQIILDLHKNKWVLLGQDNTIFAPNHSYRESYCFDLDFDTLLQAFIQDDIVLQGIDSTGEPGNTFLDPRDFDLKSRMIDIDFTPCRLPKLDESQLTDPEKGIWEIWGEAPEFIEKIKVMPRDPEKDIQTKSVAIDFGTSSTVVAMDTISGRRELLRIGVRDFFAGVEPSHFENPTVLEFLDYSSFKEAWFSSKGVYRPDLNWDWVHAAHEAQESFRDNPGDISIQKSILPRIKQWALRSCQRADSSTPTLLADRSEEEIELRPLMERNPVRGEPMSHDPDAVFDPVELYAWYLGMAINWRNRGIFLKYYLTFPVKYPREVKNLILSSFRRGLQRSLPATLISHFPKYLNDFSVEELASEPAAYAASALSHLGIEPTEEGVPYAVFDFGGGTTDFDFGFLRWATEEEEQEGYERVYVHLESSGDNYLGGENLLEHLAYLTFKGNIEELRKHRIQFTKPLDADVFPGSEVFIAFTHAAQTNTVMLSTKLRDFMERNQCKPIPQIKLSLIDAEGQKRDCELSINSEELDSYLANRIQQGVELFLSELSNSLPGFPAGSPIHILLGGNGSRSRHIKKLFDIKGDLWRKLIADNLDSAKIPKFKVHQPLPMDVNNPHAPTSKTGVALGLLRLAPGENAKLENRIAITNDGQAPFSLFVGKLRRGRFEPVLTPESSYFKWVELGPLQNGVFNLFYSASHRAKVGLKEGDPELRKQRLDFPTSAGTRLFARPLLPHQVDLLVSKDVPQDSRDSLNLRKPLGKIITLK